MEPLLIGAELPPTNNPPDESPASPSSGSIQKNWVLTSEAFEKLLQYFSPDREEAGKLYLRMRIKLMRFFEFRGCISPDELVDEVINRVARRISEGEVIFNLNGYFFEVARLVFMESLRDPAQTSICLDDAPDPPMPGPPDEEEREARLQCLDHCLERLTTQNRTLILAYYQDERRVKINHRKHLADGLGIQLNALRIRAHRIRGFLESCVVDCLAQAGLSRNKTGFSAL